MYVPRGEVHVCPVHLPSEFATTPFPCCLVLCNIGVHIGNRLIQGALSGGSVKYGEAFLCEMFVGLL